MGFLEGGYANTQANTVRLSPNYLVKGAGERGCRGALEQGSKGAIINVIVSLLLKQNLLADQFPPAPHLLRPPAQFEAEAAETQNWLEFAVKCEYMDIEPGRNLYRTYNEIIGGFVNMIKNPKPCLLK